MAGAGYDVVVIGGGHNGLACAGVLARAGRSVCVLEARDVLGGLAAAREVHPGFTGPGALLDSDGLRPFVVEELELERHGLERLSVEPPVHVPEPGGPGLALHADHDRTAAELEARSPRDAAAYLAFRARLARLAPFVRRILDARPPELDARGGRALFDLARDAVALRRLGEKDMLELIRIAPQCLRDWLEEHFEDELLRAALAAPGLEGTWMGPRSAGGVATWLARECTRGASVRGGPAAVVDALAESCAARGATLRTGARVARVLVEGGAVAGVELAGGERVAARAVVATCCPKRALSALLPPTALQPRAAADARAIRARGTVALVELALSGPLELDARPGEPVERLRTATSLDALERAFDALKYRERSARPWLEARVPSVGDARLAPAGQHVLVAHLTAAPFAREGGWDDAAREELGRLAVESLGAVASSLPGRVLHARVTTPDRLAEEYGLAEGHLFHAERALDQLLMLRPTAHSAHYGTPVTGYWLGGAGSHPGGGVGGAPGVLAARELLAARRRR